MSYWHDHPGVRSGSDLKIGERAADALRNSMGSWSFVFFSLMFLAAWMLANGNKGVDPYPFILLNLMLSCLAALQGAILLIAAKRADQVTAEAAQHHYEETTASRQEFSQRLDAIERRLQGPEGIDRPESPEGA